MSEPAVPPDKPLTDRHLRVLVVDDLGVMRLLVRNNLRSMGIEYAAHGWPGTVEIHPGLQDAPAGAGHPDHVRGRAFTGAHRHRGRHSDHRDAAGGKKALGALEYLLKPVDPEHLGRVASVLDGTS